MRWRNRMMATGRGLKGVLGMLLVGAGLLILTGLDKRLESWLVDVSPEWLTALTTRF